MIDLHSHILPGLDDGSRSIDESIALLQMLAEQGIDTVVATPHYDANRLSVADFLCCREAAFAQFQSARITAVPSVVCGAEVRYYPGISRLSGLRELCIGNCGLLLLEMPFSRWSTYTIQEVQSLTGNGSMTVVIAHVERYEAYQLQTTLQQLRMYGILMQYNASFFYQWKSRHRAMIKLRRGEISFIGSDCHNLTERPPYIGRAFDSIRKKLGQDFLTQFSEYGKSVLGIYN